MTNEATKREVKTLYVAEAEDGIRLDRWFRRRWPHLSNIQVQKMARSGQIRVDGARIKPEGRLTAGAAVRVPPIPDDTSRQAGDVHTLSPQDIKFAKSLVLYEDDMVIAINKPHGLAVQGGIDGTAVPRQVLPRAIGTDREGLEPGRGGGGDRRLALQRGPRRGRAGPGVAQYGDEQGCRTDQKQAGAGYSDGRLRQEAADGCKIIAQRPAHRGCSGGGGKNRLALGEHGQDWTLDAGVREADSFNPHLGGRRLRKPNAPLAMSRQFSGAGSGSAAARAEPGAVTTIPSGAAASRVRSPPARSTSNARTSW